MKDNLINLILDNRNSVSDKVLEIMLEKLYQAGTQAGWVDGFNNGVNYQQSN